MSDGPSLYINPKRYRYGSDASPVEPEISLSTFMLWIELQPLSTVTGMLEIIGNVVPAWAIRGGERDQARGAGVERDGEMTSETLDAAIEEAERFLVRAKKYRGVRRLHRIKTKMEPFSSDYPIERGRVKRASMDLTRALADLRRGR